MFLFQTITVCILLTIVHELAHAIIGIKFMGLTPEFIAIGIPITKKIGRWSFSTHLFTWRREGRVPLVISWLLIGGGVGFKNEEFYRSGKYRQKVQMLLSGPVSNILAGFGVALLFFGLINGLAIGWGIFSTAGSLISAMITHSSLEVAMSQSFFLPAMWLASFLLKSWWQPVCLWIFWNFMVGLFNLLPIPGLDGGHILMQGIREVGGEKTVKTIQKIDGIFLILWIAFTFLVVFKWVIF